MGYPLINIGTLYDWIFISDAIIYTKEEGKKIRESVRVKKST